MARGVFIVNDAGTVSMDIGETMKNRLTFRRQKKETGLWAIGYPDRNVDIKKNGKVIGFIHAPNWRTTDGKWRVSFAVMLTNESKWSWKHMSKRFDTEEEARNEIKRIWEKLNERYKFFEFED